jgi:hypothetical protein
VRASGRAATLAGARIGGSGDEEAPRMAAHPGPRHRGGDRPLGQPRHRRLLYHNDQQSNPIGTEERATLARLERAGKLTYLDDDTRRRYETMKRAGDSMATELFRHDPP